MNKIHWLVITVVALTLSGCVSGELKYTKPKIPKKPIQTSKVIDKDFNSSWKEMVANISTHHLVINNLEKDSGLINISFSSDNPSKYIDCGRWKGYVKNMQGRNDYEYKGEASTRFSHINGTNILTTNRTSNLTGRVNVLLQSVENNQTKINVNVRYVLSVKDRISTSQPNVYPGVDTWYISLGTNQTGRNSSGQTQCISNGSLEKLLLGYVK